MDKQNMINLVYADTIKFSSGFKRDMYKGHYIVVLVLPDDFCNYANTTRYREDDMFCLGCKVQDYPLYKGMKTLQIIGTWLSGSPDELIIITPEEYKYTGILQTNNNLLKGRLETLGG